MHIGNWKVKTLLLVATGTAALLGESAHAAEVALARIDCGQDPQPVSLASFSDTFAYETFKLPLVYSCYLIRHGDTYMIWDTGNALDGSPEAPKVSLMGQLARNHIAAEAISYVGISHHHLDHTGQAAAFPGATLLIGKGDWELLGSAAPPYGMPADDFATRRDRLAPWIKGTSKTEVLHGDRKDLFGDGTVVMISLPGHTPGHHGLLVKLESKGYVLLSGDVSHFQENHDSNGVPTWNNNRAASLASLDRFKKIASNLKATVIIQHDPRDVAKLPAFPAFAE